MNKTFRRQASQSTGKGWASTWVSTQMISGTIAWNLPAHFFAWTMKLHLQSLAIFYITLFSNYKKKKEGKNQSFAHQIHLHLKLILIKMRCEPNNVNPPSASIARSPARKSESIGWAPSTRSSSSTAILMAVFISDVRVSRYILNTAGSFAWILQQSNMIKYFTKNSQQSKNVNGKHIHRLYNYQHKVCFIWHKLQLDWHWCVVTLMTNN